MDIPKESQCSSVLRFSELAAQKNQKGERIYSLGLKELVTKTPREIKEAALTALEEGYTNYSHPMGLGELRGRIKEKFLYDNGIETAQERIMVTPGAKQAMSYALKALLEPNDSVINITPCYSSYIPQIKIAEMTAKIHNVELDKETFSLDWDKVWSVMNKSVKVIILNFPHNPTGILFSQADMENLLKLMTQHDCYIIADEIYDKMIYADGISLSPASMSEIRDKVITINGFSKSFSMTGWRLGYITGPKDVMKVISYLQLHSATHPCLFAQKGACAAFDLPKEYFQKIKDDLFGKAKFLEKRLVGNERLHFNTPKSGMFALLDISGTGFTSGDFAYRLLKEKDVATTPGITLGGSWNDHVRISLSAEKEEFEEGVLLLEEFVNAL
jgi:aspartate aminotransferase